MNEQVVSLEISQIPSASGVLGAAFRDNSLFKHFAVQDDLKRLSTTQLMSRLLLRYAHRYEAIYATTDTTTQVIKGVAIWIPPKQFPLNDFRLLMEGGYAIPFKLRLSKLLQLARLFFKIEARHKVHVSQPHWYLMMLGVHPDYQGQGIGSALIQPVLAKADAENMPCYLETSTADAVRFYRRQGFEVVEKNELAGEDLGVWLMVRSPEKALRGDSDNRCETQHPSIQNNIAMCSALHLFNHAII